jgi:hypothetical protein
MQPEREFYPNKSKQNQANCLDFLGFVRPNRDFSKGYEQKNKKIGLASQVVCKASPALLSPSHADRRGARFIRRMVKAYR